MTVESVIDCQVDCCHRLMNLDQNDAMFSLGLVLVAPYYDDGRLFVTSEENLRVNSSMTCYPSIICHILYCCGPLIYLCIDLVMTYL